MVFWDKLSEHTKLVFLKWSYLAIVVAATITLVVVVNQNRQLVNHIQNDRKQIIYENCLDQNSKHKQLINFIDKNNLKKAKKRAIEEGRPEPIKPPPINPTTREFIDLLAEQRNCQQLVVDIFGTPFHYLDKKNN